MSDPVDRDIKTIKLSPILASQAPIVNRTIAKCGIKILLMWVNNTIMSIDVRSMASRQNRARSRWEY